MNIDPVPAADEAAAISVALAALRHPQDPPIQHSAWRLAERMPWLADDDIRARTRHDVESAEATLVRL